MTPQLAPPMAQIIERQLALAAELDRKIDEHDSVVESYSRGLLG